jgi:hypothetical protein
VNVKEAENQRLRVDADFDTLKTFYGAGALLLRRQSGAIPWRPGQPCGSTMQGPLTFSALQFSSESSPDFFVAAALAEERRSQFGNWMILPPDLPGLHADVLKRGEDETEEAFGQRLLACSFQRATTNRFFQFPQFETEWLNIKRTKDAAFFEVFGFYPMWSVRKYWASAPEPGPDDDEDLGVNRLEHWVFSTGRQWDPIFFDKPRLLALEARAAAARAQVVAKHVKGCQVIRVDVEYL